MFYFIFIYYYIKCGVFVSQTIILDTNEKTKEAQGDENSNH